MIRQLEQLDLVSIERKARVLTHQLASLTLLAYTKSLAEHKDAPMFGHTVRRAAATNSFNLAKDVSHRLTQPYVSGAADRRPDD